LGASLGASVAVNAGEAGVDCGTVDVIAEGKTLTQIAAIDNQAMDDADTVTGTKWGGWLLVTDPNDGTTIYALAADGKAGAVSAMAYNTKALTQTALDTLEDRLPKLCVVVGRIFLNNVGGANAWEATTDNWDHDTAVATVEDAVFGEHNRTGDDVGPSKLIDAPTLPATITAPVNPTVGSPAVTEKVKSDNSMV
jgi:hypothetical protein